MLMLCFTVYSNHIPVKKKCLLSVMLMLDISDKVLTVENLQVTVH